MTDRLSLCVLGSSSAGNATLVWNSESALLVDCGFGPVYIERQMRLLGLRLSDLTGVLITHTHGDHVNGRSVQRLMKANVPLYCPTDLALPLQGIYPAVADAGHAGLLRLLAEPEAEVGSFLVRPFPVPHDSPGGCFGYSLFDGVNGRTRKVSIATDLAYPSRGLAGHFANSDALVIESNHDTEMLENSGRPIWLKRRIREVGHLSNDQCAEFLVQVIDHSHRLPETMVLAHLSQECNTGRIAMECAFDAVRRFGSEERSLVKSSRDAATRRIEVG